MIAIPKIPVSVLILTKDEQKDLPGCLDSVTWSNDIHVYDSFSDDRTVEIAQRFGAKVSQRAFDNWSLHQNWGLRNLAFANEWVLYLDADERVTPELRNHIAEAITDPGKCVAFEVRRRDFLNGTWLKHVQATPRYIRLFRPEYIRYERLVNPITIVDGPQGQLGGFLDHHPFSKGLAHWVRRHNSYSDLEAQEVVAKTINATGEWKSALFGADYAARRASQKSLYYKLPCRPIIKFLYMYIAKLGFLDGSAGFEYAVLVMFYEYLIALKASEILRPVSDKF